MRRFLSLVLFCTLMVACGGGGGGGNPPPPPPPIDNVVWIIQWSQPLFFTDSTPLIPERDIGGYRVYVADSPYFNDNSVFPIMLADVGNELIKDGELYIQTGNITAWQQASMDNTIRNMKGDCTHWIAVKALSPTGSGEEVESEFSNPFPWGPDLCIE